MPPPTSIDRLPGALVVLKPAGLASEAPRDPSADSLVRRLAAEGHRDLRLVHRLDAAACGLMLVATSREAAGHYAADIAARRWHKLYVARVSLPPVEAARLIGAHKAYLKVDGRAARVVRAGGKPSFLDVLATAPVIHGADDTHVLVRLHTGRFHQIRVMLAHLGAPLAGDVTYGGTMDAGMYLEHVALGAFTHTTLTWTVWQAPPHADRDPWSPELADAVTRAVVTARTAPPPRDPAP